MLSVLKQNFWVSVNMSNSSVVLKLSLHFLIAISMRFLFFLRSVLIAVASCQSLTKEAWLHQQRLGTGA